MTMTALGSRPLHGGVDRNVCDDLAAGAPDRRPLHGGVDRNRPANPAATAAERRPLHGGVDRNHSPAAMAVPMSSRPLHGGVDRNGVALDWSERSYSRPFTGAWIETRARTRGWTIGRGRPLHGGVDRNHGAIDLAGLAALSPPSRGRGSKRRSAPRVDPPLRSPPSRGRGSKLEKPVVTDDNMPSPPSRGRGSKPHRGSRPGRPGSVAPFTGAWIETVRRAVARHGSRGRPLHGGVDRNPHAASDDRPDLRSPPSRGRGSKQSRHLRHARRRMVAPFTGAWIETRIGEGRQSGDSVAPFTGAWIET